MKLFDTLFIPIMVLYPVSTGNDDDCREARLTFSCGDGMGVVLLSLPAFSCTNVVQVAVRCRHKGDAT